jgi:catechol 2,3-dioxygenase-like lactoylglutathione lyase family enzyme
MPAQLDHTIVNALDPEGSARFVAELLDLAPPHRFGPFFVVELANGVSLDYIVAAPDEVIIEHYAFLVSEAEFDAIFARIRERGLPYWADPAKAQPGAINRHDGGRGVYWDDPSGHLLEIITRRYGSGSAASSAAP